MRPAPVFAPVRSLVLGIAASAALTVAGLGAQAPADNTLTAAETKAGWTLLFDGKTIDKFRGNNAQGVPPMWAVVDGAIVAAPAKGGVDLVTVEEYTDFELAVDFKIAKNGNSGIFYRGVETPGAPIYHSAPEYQVLDDTGHPDAKNGPDRFCGANYAIEKPLVSACKPAGEWNSARSVVKGAHVEHWLNGQKTADYELWSPAWKDKVAASKFKAWPNYGMAKSGRLALQHHGDEVAFKNVKLRILK
jgi:hypothetical protein